MSASGLKLRIVTSIFMTAVIISLLFLAPDPVVLVFFTALAIAAAWEWSAFVSRRPGVRRLYVLAFLPAIAVCWLAKDDSTFVHSTLYVAGGWWLIAAAWILFRPSAGLNALVTAVAGFLVVIPMWVAAVHFQTGEDFGPEWLFFVIVMVVAADTGAYFTGRAIGRRPLAPKVSPNKTWEGVAGGVVLAALVAYAGNRWFGQPLLAFLLLSIIVVGFSVIGDLNVSRFKRNADLKDSGHWLPGHGGILDRIDSMSAAIPLFLLGLAVLL